MPEDTRSEVLWRIEFQRHPIPSIGTQRHLAESCLRRLLEWSPDTPVERDESGAPTVKGDTGKGSLSHTTEAVSAAWSRCGHRLGVDVESETAVTRLPKTAWGAWMSAYERMLADRHPGHLAVLWAAKEAATKALSRPFSPAFLEVLKISDDGVIEVRDIRAEIRLLGRWGYHHQHAYVLLTDALTALVSNPLVVNIE